jgi:hypothetical protein
VSTPAESGSSWVWPRGAERAADPRLAASDQEFARLYDGPTLDAMWELARTVHGVRAGTTPAPAQYQASEAARALVAAHDRSDRAAQRVVSLYVAALGAIEYGPGDPLSHGAYLQAAIMTETTMAAERAVQRVNDRLAAPASQPGQHPVARPVHDARDRVTPYGVPPSLRSDRPSLPADDQAQLDALRARLHGAAPAAARAADTTGAAPVPGGDPGSALAGARANSAAHPDPPAAGLRGRPGEARPAPVVPTAAEREAADVHRMRGAVDQALTAALDPRQAFARARTALSRPPTPGGTSRTPAAGQPAPAAAPNLIPAAAVAAPAPRTAGRPR